MPDKCSLFKVRGSFIRSIFILALICVCTAQDQADFCNKISDVQSRLLKKEDLINRKILEPSPWQTFDKYELKDFPQGVQLVTAQYPLSKKISVHELLWNPPAVYDFSFIKSEKEELRGLYLEILIDEPPYNVAGGFFVPDLQGYKQIVSFENSMILSCLEK